MSAFAKGSLARTPFAHLLVYCLDRSLSGTLVFQSSNSLRHAIYIESGSPAKVRTGSPFCYFGQVLIDIGAIDEKVRQESYEEKERRGGLHGELLLRSGYIDRATLRDALRVQLRRKLLHLCQLPPDTLFAFYRGQNLLASWGGPDFTPIEPLAILHQAVCYPGNWPRIEAAIAAISQQPLVLSHEGDLFRFQPSEQEQTIVDRLRVAPTSVSELEATGIATRQDIYTFLYSLFITRYVYFGNREKAPVGLQVPPSLRDNSLGSTATALARLKLRRVVSSSVPSVEIHATEALTVHQPFSSRPPAAAADSVSSLSILPPFSRTTSRAVTAPVSSLSLEQQVRRAELAALAENLEQKDYYQLLGVPRESTNNDIKKAFLVLAKKWHPDRISPALEDVRLVAADVFSKINKAFQTLDDPVLRTSYDEAMASQVSPDDEAVSHVVAASLDFQKAEIFWRKGNRIEAEQYAQAAVNKDNANTDYRAFLLWLQAQSDPLSPATLAGLIKELDAILVADGEHRRSLWYRGNLLRKVGREDAAMRDFRRLVEIDPRHTDASREIRLHDMRRRTARR